MSRLAAKPPRFPTVDDLIANATDFLKSATADLKTRPKHSVIAFYTAVELVLKARLMAEHWTLAVSKNADRGSFAKGDFVSVGFDEACVRLRNVVGSPLSDDARAIFDNLRKHRNKMVYFYHEGEADEAALEAIALEQLLGWRALVGLIENQWQAVFANMAFDVTAIDAGFAEHRLYAKAKFESLTERLKAITDAGGILARCRSCTYEAAEENEDVDGTSWSRCLVCGRQRRWIVAACPSCGEKLENEGDDGARCDSCGTRFSVEQLVDELNEEIITKDNYMDVSTPANCASCEGYHTVIAWRGNFVCVACIETVDELETCGWCGEANTGDMEGSGLTGCSACDGNAKQLYEE